MQVQPVPMPEEGGEGSAVVGVYEVQKMEEWCRCKYENSVGVGVVCEQWQFGCGMWTVPKWVQYGDSASVGVG